MDEVERAQKVLARERAEVLAALGAARDEARQMAERRRAWKAEVNDLINRGRAAGLLVKEMAEALGVTRQWAAQLTPGVVIEKARRRQGGPGAEGRR
jgi:hypothetical protein